MSLTTVSVRKKPRSVKCPMPASGVCPFDKCEWICKSKNPSTFAMHITKKHSADLHLPSVVHSCLVCAEEFSTKGELRQHHVTAHEPRKWKCPDCSYLAKNKSTLITHVVRKHRGYHYDKDCVDDNGNCVHCHKPRPTTGHIYHIGICLGVDKAVAEFNS